MTYLEQLAQEIEAEARLGVEQDGDMRELFLTYAVLALAKGEETTARDVHDAWAAWMVPREPRHEAIVPYSQLAADVQLEDDQFVEAIRRVARRGVERYR